MRDDLREPLLLLAPGLARAEIRCGVEASSLTSMGSRHGACARAGLWSDAVYWEPRTRSDGEAALAGFALVFVQLVEVVLSGRSEGSTPAIPPCLQAGAHVQETIRADEGHST